jgi:hypothetical protein
MMMKPKAILRSDGSALVSLPTGRSARISPLGNPALNQWHWSLQHANAEGSCYSRDGAIRQYDLETGRRI